MSHFDRYTVAMDDGLTTISGTVVLPAGSSGRIDVWAQARDRSYDSEYGWDGFDDTTTNEDGSYTIAVDAGRSYCIWASIARSHEFDPDPLLTTAYGGFVTARDSLEDADLADQGISWVTTPTDGGSVSGIDIVMRMGAMITGRVLFPEGTPGNSDDMYLRAVSSDDMYLRGVAIIREVGGSTRYDRVSSDGSFEFTAIPGARYVLGARIDGYAVTWMGGGFGFQGSLPGPEMTEIVAPEPGQTLADQDIRLRVGASLSGTIRGGGEQARVGAYLVEDDGVLTLANSSSVDEDGHYRVAGLTPGGRYMVRVWGDCLPTWYATDGGTADLSSELINEIIAGPDGSHLSDVDITAVQPFTVVGRIHPPPAVEGTTAYVLACMVYRKDGQTHYRKSFGNMGSSMRYGLKKPRAHRAAIQERFTVWVPRDSRLAMISDLETRIVHDRRRLGPESETGAFLFELLPDQDYVIVACCKEYEDSWHGGYAGDSGLSDVDGDFDAPLPSSHLISVISGSEGQVLQGVDIALGGSDIDGMTIRRVSSRAPSDR